MARRAVVLPAPFGPMSPTMRPASTEKLARSSATCAPYFFVRSRASMSAGMMILSFFLGVAAAGRRGRVGYCRCLREQFLRREPEPVDDRQNLRPLLVQEPLALSGQ